MERVWIPAVLVVLLLVLLAALWIGLRNRRGSDSARSSSGLDTLAAWEPQGTRVLTPPERQALKLLAVALPEYLVLAQVPLARFIRVPTRYSYSEWLRRVGQLSPDLLICDGASQVIAVVDIRPPAQQMSARARERAERMRRVLKAAGIPMHVWVDNALPSLEAVRDAIVPKPPAVVSSGLSAPPAAAAPAARPVASAGLRTLMADDAPMEPDEVIEMREPPPSTWFDDLDSKPTPLARDPRRPPR